MVWGECTELRVIENGVLYITKVLEEIIVPFASFIGDGFTFTRDNARSHTEECNTLIK